MFNQKIYKKLKETKYSNIYEILMLKIERVEKKKN